MRLTRQELDRLRGVRLHSVLGLADNGRRVSICCPLHNETDPSFYIFIDGGFKCFGCGAKGRNALDFMVLLEGSFISGVESLLKYV